MNTYAPYAGRACHDCGQALDHRAVMVFRNHPSAGLIPADDPAKPGAIALRCATCEDKIQHPEPRSTR